MEITDFQDVSRIKGIIFDLDGVLVDTRPLHYHCLNRALGEIDAKYVITPEEHHDHYDGLSTNVKLEMLTNEKQLPRSLHKQVWRRKQDLTAEETDNLLKPSPQLISLFQELSRRGYLLYCASNAIYDTVKRMLNNVGVLPYLDYFVSNEDVIKGKPNPEMYYKCIARMGFHPSQVLILEDSPVGREAALMSGAHLMPIETPDDVTVERVTRAIAHIEAQALQRQSQRTVQKVEVQVLLPCAGPCPPDRTPNFLRDVRGLPMIKLTVDNLGFKGTHIFVVQTVHYDRYNLGQLLSTVSAPHGDCHIVQLDKVTEGAACSALEAREFVDNDLPLLVANPDQYMLWEPGQFLEAFVSCTADGMISTFHHKDPRFSYVEVDPEGYAIKVTDDPAGGIATTGVYLFKRGSDFVKYAEKMIAKNVRTRGLFYVHNVFNEMIADGKRVKTQPLEEVLSTGIFAAEDFMRLKEIAKQCGRTGSGWRRSVKW